jgi:hypothetical protein
MSERRTIRDIRIKKQDSEIRHVPVLKTEMKSVAHQEAVSFDRSRISQVPEKNNSRNHGRVGMWGTALGLTLLAGVLIANTFYHAVIRITSQEVSVPVETTLTAFQEPGDGQLPFEIMILEGSESQIIEAQAEGVVERFASGVIVVINEEPSVQRFREETRFETSDGLIFKIPKGDGITVPAAQDGNPGQLEVTVYAEKPGEAYNIPPSDFVIPGWKEINNPKFTTQYARSTTPMTGGFVGVEKSVDPYEEEAAQSILKDALVLQLEKSSSAQIPATFTWFPEGVRTIFQPLVKEAQEGNAVRLVQNGSLEIMLFNKEELSTLLAQKLLPGYDGNPVEIKDWGTLTVRIESNPEVLIQNLSEINVFVSGEATFVSQVRAEDVYEKLQGVKKRDFREVAYALVGIEEAKVSIKPFWKRSIPVEKKNIKIYIQDEKKSF